MEQSDDEQKQGVINGIPEDAPFLSPSFLFSSSSSFTLQDPRNQQAPSSITSRPPFSPILLCFSPLRKPSRTFLFMHQQVWFPPPSSAWPAITSCYNSNLASSSSKGPPPTLILGVASSSRQRDIILVFALLRGSTLVYSSKLILSS